MDVSAVWKEFFGNWPDGMPRQGTLVTSLGQQIPFSGFLTSETILLIQRKSPDAEGTRQVLLPYQNIDSIKVTEIVKPKVFTANGFEGTLPKK